MMLLVLEERLLLIAVTRVQKAITPEPFPFSVWWVAHDCIEVQRHWNLLRFPFLLILSQVVLKSSWKRRRISAHQMWR